MSPPRKFPPPCKSLDEALAWAHSDAPRPKRPRNEFERQAFARQGGRPPRGQGSAVHQAAMLALHLAETDGLTQRQAAVQAGAVYKTHPDAVRKAARRLRDGPTVQLRRSVQVLGVQFVDKKRTAMLASVDDACELS